MENKSDPLSADSAEQASQRGNEEVVDALGNHARSALNEVTHAIARIESGEYLYCENCGQEILEKRLEILPYTEYCTACAEKLEQSH
ncbi:MAG: TraR/DksA family transcriptional regulator [Granulosicoccaceae bacterium]